jgi:hypothetical protein
LARRTDYFCAAALENTMSQSQTQQLQKAHYELRFHSLYKPGRGYSVPCDASGRVDMDSLSDSERHQYLYARAIVGHELALPAVQQSDR